MTEPRAYTSEELTHMLLSQIMGMAKYWANVPAIDKATGREMTTLERCEGVVHSILATLDGSTMNLPAVKLVFQPHEEDKEFWVEQGQNWIEPGTEIDTVLHEGMYSIKPGMEPSEIHNRMAKSFVFMAGRMVGDWPDLMVLMETMMVASASVLKHRHGMTHDHAFALMNEAMQKAKSYPN